MFDNTFVANSGSVPILVSSNHGEHNLNSNSCKPQSYMPWAHNSRINDFSRQPQNNTRPNRPPYSPAMIRAISADNRFQARNSPSSVSIHNTFRPAQMNHYNYRPPSSDLSLCSSPEPSTMMRDIRPFEQSMTKGQPHAIAEFDFETAVAGDLHFKRGDLIILEEIVDDAWYRGRALHTGQVGIFPMNHVQVRIPLEHSLYISSQRKPTIPFAHILNGSTASEPPNPTMQSTFTHHIVKSGSAQEGDLRHSNSSVQSSVPKRPSRSRIASLSTKFESNPVALLPSRALTTIASSHIRRTQSNSAVHHHLTPRTQTPDPVRHPTSFQPTTEVANLTVPEPTIRSLTNPVVNSLRPNSQTSISSLVHSLEQRGVTATRVGQLPPGAKPLYPPNSEPNQESSVGSHILNAVGTGEQSSPMGRIRDFQPTPQMVETPLVMIARMQNQNHAPPSSTFARNGTTSDQMKSKTNISDHTVRTPSRPITFPSVTAPYTQLHENQSDPDVSNRRINTIVHTTIDSVIKPICTDSGDWDILNNNLNPNQTAHSPSISHLAQDVKTPRISSEKRLGKIALVIGDETVTGPIDDEQDDYASECSARSLSSSQLQWSFSSKPLVMDGTNASPQVTHPPSPTKSAGADLLPNFPVTTAATSSYTDLSKPATSSAANLVDQWLLVLHDFNGEQPGDLLIKAGQLIQCLDPLPERTSKNELEIPDRWLHCVTWFNVQGQVPSTYVRRIADTQELERWMKYRPRAEVVFEFKAENPNDLTLKIGDIIYLYDAVDANWFRGESSTTGIRGMFPVQFVRVLCPL